MAKTLRIHGDNIVECERALKMLAEALGGDPVTWIDSPLHAPVYRVASRDGEHCDVQLLPGYGRWHGDIVGALRSRGAPLPEAADAVITELAELDGLMVERLIIGIEFCSSLPAGNNAWQRCGRSYSYALSGVPYLYVSELGGYELDSSRVLKAPRLPNPLVPFAYSAQSQLSETFALPVYIPSPSIDDRFYAAYEDVFSWTEALDLLRALVAGAPLPPAQETLMDRGIEIAKRIASTRRPGGLRGAQWDELLARRGNDRLVFLVKSDLPWSKTISIPITDTLRVLLAGLKRLASGIGSADMPFAVIPGPSRPGLAQLLDGTYGASGLAVEFREWIADATAPLVVVLVAGFKPRGDDSRPDRGLLPLARMVLGESAQVLAVVYGPGSAIMWKRFQVDLPGLRKTNGLWASVAGLSDAILVDSMTLSAADGILTGREPRLDDSRFGSPPAVMRPASTAPDYSEQDVDTVIKMIAAGASDTIFEGLCNPPGGDWSGISVRDFDQDIEYRWTSLPRVTAENGKRPDHVLQFFGLDAAIILSIESKDRVGDFEARIGPRLAQYVRDLIRTPPTIARAAGSSRWAHNETEIDFGATVLSAGAYILNGDERTVRDALLLNELDIAIGLSFPTPDTSRVVIAHRPEADKVVSALVAASARLGRRIEIEVHALKHIVK